MHNRCQKSFDISDAILLNPTEEDEIETLKTKMEARRNKVKDAKEAKKDQKKAEVIPSTSTSSNSKINGTNEQPSTSTKSADKRKAGNEKTKNGLKSSTELGARN